MEVRSATDSVAASAQLALQRSRKRAPRPELVCEAVFRPLAHLVVLALLPLRISPPAVVLLGARQASRPPSSSRGAI